jgi:hypothetical protein
MTFFIQAETAMGLDSLIFSLRCDTNVTREMFEEKLKQIDETIKDVSFIDRGISQFSDGTFCQLFAVPIDANCQKLYSLV